MKIHLRRGEMRVDDENGYDCSKMIIMIRQDALNRDEPRKWSYVKETLDTYTRDLIISNLSISIGLTPSAFSKFRRSKHHFDPCTYSRNRMKIESWLYNA